VNARADSKATVERNIKGTRFLHRGFDGCIRLPQETRNPVRRSEIRRHIGVADKSVATSLVDEFADCVGLSHGERVVRLLQFEEVHDGK
jgi:hypothetical protein